MASEARPRRRNPKGQGQALKAEFVAAAARLLATMDRPETLTLRQVAREVGVAPASIYSHFPHLDALVQHVLWMRYDELAHLMDEAAHSAAEPLGELIARCASYVEWGVAHPGEYRTLFGGALPPELVPLHAHGAGEELLDALVTALAAARDPGSAAPATTESRWQAGLILWTSLHGLTALYAAHGDLPWPPLRVLLAELIALHTGWPVGDIERRLPALPSPPGRPAAD